MCIRDSILSEFIIKKYESYENMVERKEETAMKKEYLDKIAEFDS